MEERKNDIEEKFQEWLDGSLDDDQWEKIKSDSKKRDDYDRLERFASESSKLEAPEGRTTEEAWNLLENQLEEGEDEKVIHISIWQRRSFQLGIAASILLLTGFFVFQNLNSQLSISANAGKHLSHTLPDGSEVELNASSSIQYAKNAWTEDRKLELTGEAFFRVEKGSSFSVITENGTVTVLGTQFNVKSRGKTFEVICTEGKVEVQAANANSIVLTENTSVKLIDNQLVKRMNQDTEDKIGWMDGLFVFENEQLQYVIAELERQFDVDIQASEELLDRPYTGFFESYDLENALESVFSPLQISYKLKGKEVIVE